MKQYNKYKPTTNEWLSDIPQQWTSIKLKYVSDYQEGPGIMANDFMPEGVPLIRISGVKSRILTKDGCNYLSNEKVQKIWNHFKLQEGDLVISGSATSGLIAKVTNDCVGSILYTGLIRFRKTDSVEQDFLEVFLSSRLFNEQVDVQKSGTAIQHFGPTHLSNVFLALPPKDEQKSIANYANYKTSLIDSLISKNQKQIELLEEKKQAMINQAVTKGLDPKVKMNDSGIGWIGEIPEHWQVKKLKYLAEVVTGTTPPKSDFLNYSDDGIPWIKPDDLNQFKPISESKEKISEKGLAYSRIIPKGSVLVCGIGSIGKFGIADVDLTTNQQINSIIFNNFVEKCYGRYLVFCSKKEMEANSNKVVVSILNKTNQQNIFYPLPPLEEQENISKYLDKINNLISKQITNIKKQNTFLLEYRQALISNVVTGKIDVRDEKIPEKYITN